MDCSSFEYLVNVTIWHTKTMTVIPETKIMLSYAHRTVALSALPYNAMHCFVAWAILADVEQFCMVPGKPCYACARSSNVTRRTAAAARLAGLRIPEEWHHSRGRCTGVGACQAVCLCCAVAAADAAPEPLHSTFHFMRLRRAISGGIHVVGRLPVWYSRGGGEQNCCSAAQKSGEA